MASAVSVKQNFSSSSAVEGGAGVTRPPADRPPPTNGGGVDRSSSGVTYPGQRCDCCPYNYHIDLDFLRFLEAQTSPVDGLRSLRRVRHSPSRHSERPFDYDFSLSPTSSSHNVSFESPSKVISDTTTITTTEILNEIDTAIFSDLFSVVEVTPRPPKQPKLRPPVRLEVVLAPESSAGINAERSDQRYRMETTLYVTGDDATKGKDSVREKEDLRTGGDGGGVVEGVEEEGWQGVGKLVSQIEERQQQAEKARTRTRAPEPAARSSLSRGSSTDKAALNQGQSLNESTPGSRAQEELAMHSTIVHQEQLMTSSFTSSVTSSMTSSVTSPSQELAEQSQLLDESIGESGTISPAVLQAIRNQMAASLQRMRELEDQVRTMSLLQSEISNLREENRRLLLLSQSVASSSMFDTRVPNEHPLLGQVTISTNQNAVLFRPQADDSGTQTESLTNEPPFNDEELRGLYEWRQERSAKIEPRENGGNFRTENRLVQPQRMYSSEVGTEFNSSGILTNRQFRSIGVGDENVFGDRIESASSIVSSAYTVPHVSQSSVRTSEVVTSRVTAQPRVTISQTALQLKQAFFARDATELNTNENLGAACSSGLYQSCGDVVIARHRGDDKYRSPVELAMNRSMNGSLHEEHLTVGLTGEKKPEICDAEIQCELITEANASLNPTPNQDSSHADANRQLTAGKIGHESVQSEQKDSSQHVFDYAAAKKKVKFALDGDRSSRGVVMHDAWTVPDAGLDLKALFSSSNARLKDAWTITDLRLGSRDLDDDSLADILLDRKKPVTSPDVPVIVIDMSEPLPEESEAKVPGAVVAEAKNGNKEQDEVKKIRNIGGRETESSDFEMVECSKSDVLTSTQTFEDKNEKIVDTSVEGRVTVFDTASSSNVENIIVQSASSPPQIFDISSDSESSVASDAAVKSVRCGGAVTTTTVDQDWQLVDVQSMAETVSTVDGFQPQTDKEQSRTVSASNSNWIDAQSSNSIPDGNISIEQTAQRIECRDSMVSLSVTGEAPIQCTAMEGSESMQASNGDETFLEQASGHSDDSITREKILGSSEGDQESISNSQMDNNDGLNAVGLTSQTARHPSIEEQTSSVQSDPHYSNLTQSTEVMSKITHQMNFILDACRIQSTRSEVAEVAANESEDDVSEVGSAVDSTNESECTMVENIDSLAQLRAIGPPRDDVVTLSAPQAVMVKAQQLGSDEVQAVERLDMKDAQGDRLELVVKGEGLQQQVSSLESGQLNVQVNELEAASESLSPLADGSRHVVITETCTQRQLKRVAKGGQDVSEFVAQNQESTEYGATSYQANSLGCLEKADSEAGIAESQETGEVRDEVGAQRGGLKEERATGGGEEGASGSVGENQRFSMDAELLAACSMYAQWLSDPESVPADDVRQAEELVQRQWFLAAGRKVSDSLEVKAYLTIFTQLGQAFLDAVVNLVDGDGNTVLHYAVSHANFEVVSALLECGVCAVDRENRAGYSALLLVALLTVDTERHHQLIHQLFSIGDVNAMSSSSGQTALMLAASHNRLETVALLLACGANVNAQDEDGSTALMCASEHGHTDIIRALLAAPGCDSTVADVDGSTALSIAVEEGHQEIGVLLYAHLKAFQAERMEDEEELEERA